MSGKKDKKRTRQMCSEEGCEHWPAATIAEMPRFCMKHLILYLGKDKADIWRERIKEKNRRLCDEMYCWKGGNTKWENGNDAHYLCRKHYKLAVDDARLLSLIRRVPASGTKKKKRSGSTSASLAMRLAGKEKCAVNKTARVVCTKRNCLMLAGGDQHCENDISRYRENSIIDNRYLVEEFSDGVKGNGLRMKLTCRRNFEEGDIMGSFWANSASSRESNLKAGERVEVLFALNVVRSMVQSVTASDAMRAGLINHTCGLANCRMETVEWSKDDDEAESFVAVFAERQISKADVLCIHYGTRDQAREFFASKGEKCKCGDENCISKTISTRYK